MLDEKRDAPQLPRPISSSNSGAYNPGPMYPETDLPTLELSGVQSHNLDLALEEFPEGPYGAALDEERLGKVSDWEPGQAVSGRFRDSNLISSDRTAALHEPQNPAPDQGIVPDED